MASGSVASISRIFGYLSPCHSFTEFIVLEGCVRPAGKKTHLGSESEITDPFSPSGGASGPVV